MQQYTEPATAKVADDDNLTAAPWANADAHGSDVAYRRLVDDQWQDVTFSTFRDEVATAAKGFLAAGLQPGDRVGPHLADALRVDAARLRPLGGRRGRPSRSTRPRRPTRSSGACPTPAPRA